MKEEWNKLAEYYNEQQEPRVVTVVKVSRLDWIFVQFISIGLRIVPLFLHNIRRIA